MAYCDEQREAETGADLELNWALNLKFTKINPLKSGQVIALFKGEYIILDFDINNGGEFYKWNEITGVMQKAVKPKMFAVLPVVFGDYQ